MGWQVWARPRLPFSAAPTGCWCCCPGDPTLHVHRVNRKDILPPCSIQFTEPLRIQEVLTPFKIRAKEEPQPASSHEQEGRQLRTRRGDLCPCSVQICQVDAPWTTFRAALSVTLGNSKGRSWVLSRDSSVLVQKETHCLSGMACMHTGHCCFPRDP